MPKMSKKEKELKRLEKATGLAFGGAVTLEGLDVIKSRKSPVALKGIASGTLGIGVTAAVSQTTLKLATDGPVPLRKKRR